MDEMRTTFGKYLAELGNEYKNLYVVDADLKTSTKTVLFEEAHPDRLLQVGIAEQNMVGMSAGLSLGGKIPVACTFAAFLSQRVLDQVVSSVAYPKLNVKLAGAYCGVFASHCGATHMSLEDLAIFRSMPNMYVADATDNEELKQVIKAAIDYEGPVYFRVNRGAPDAIITEGLKFEWGKGHVLKDGKDVTIVSTGITSQWALQAANLLEAEGISARMIHMPSIKPFDEELLLKAAQETKAIVTVENHSINGGLGGLVAEILSEKCPTKLHRIGVKDFFGQTAPDSELIEFYGFDPQNIAKETKEFIQE